MVDTGQLHADQVEYWNGTGGARWVSNQSRTEIMLGEVAELALARAAPAPGETVIDIGCGCGSTSIALAGKVGPSGHVLAVDVSAPILAVARERLAGYDTVETVLADAASYDFPKGKADLLFSRFGVMFFADAGAAFANLRTGIRPGGRLLCAVWRPMAENSWFSVPLGAGLPLLPEQPPADPDAPGPFAFRDPARVRAILTGAGWRDIDIRPRDVPMQVGGLDTATDFLMRLGALARLVAEVDPDTRSRVRDVVRAALAPHEGPAGVVLGGAIWQVSARA